LAKSHGLMPNASLEVLNEAAMDLGGEPVLESDGGGSGAEGDWVHEVNQDMVKELLG
jgi:TerB-C domain